MCPAGFESEASGSRYWVSRIPSPRPAGPLGDCPRLGGEAHGKRVQEDHRRHVGFTRGPRSNSSDAQLGLAAAAKIDAIGPWPGPGQVAFPAWVADRTVRAGG